MATKTVNKIFVDDSNNLVIAGGGLASGPVEETYTTDPQYFVYNVNSTYSQITGYDIQGGLDIDIPAELGGFPVETIFGAFANLGIENLNLPNTVKLITNMAFREAKITSLVLPSSVEELGYGAFIDCRDLTSVTLNEGLVETGAWCFRECGATSVNIPSTLTTIGDYFFYEGNLTSITIPDTVVTLGNNAFYRNDLRSITLPENGITTIPTYAFFFNPNLESITIPANITTLGQNCFANCNISSLTIESPTPITLISGVFMENALTSIDLTQFDDIGTYSFKGNNLTSVHIPSGLIWGDSSFEGNNLTSVTFEDGVTTIPDRAFNYNNNPAFTTIVLPLSITSVGSSAFQQAPLDDITIGANVTLGAYAMGPYYNSFNTEYITNNGSAAGRYTRVGSVWTKVA